MASSDQSHPPFRVELAQPHELRAVRMLLPAAFESSVSPLVYVATTGADASVVGAAGMTPRPQGRVSGFTLMLRVAKPFRLRGIGRALVEAATVEAQARGVKALYAPDAIEPNGEEALAWNALGFRSRVHVNYYEADGLKMTEVVAPIWEQVQQRGWVPAEARVVGMREVPPEALARLHVTQLGGSYEWIRRRIEGTAPESFDPELSYVLLMGDRLVGAALGRAIEPGVGFFDAIIVLPELRLGWAQLMLKMHVAQRGMAKGYTTLRFTAHDQHKDTRRMASKSGATLVKTMVIPFREI